MTNETVGSDRFLHDYISEMLAGKRNKRKDAAIDIGAKHFGSRHRSEYPHRSATEMAMFLNLQDIKEGRTPDVLSNAKLVMGHNAVDSLPTEMKTRLQLIRLLAGVTI